MRLLCRLRGHRWIGPFRLSQRCSWCDTARYPIEPMPLAEIERLAGPLHGWPLESDGVSNA